MVNKVFIETILENKKVIKINANRKTLEFSLEERIKFYDKAIQLHNNLGWGYKKIGNFLGINQATVSDWLYRGRSPLTVYNKVKKTQNYLNSRNGVRQLKLEERIKLYYRALKLRKKFGWGCKRIAKKLKLYPSTVNGWIQGKSSPLKKINTFERKPSQELSYITGVIIGDGNLRLKIYKVRPRTGRIRLTVKDKEFALIFNKCVAKLLQRKKLYSIRPTKDGRYEVAAFSLMLAEFLVQEFDNLKSFIEAYPSDFIRGFVDSEGWPNTTAGKEFDIEVQISNSCKDILEHIKLLLQRHFDIKSVITPCRSPGTISFKNGKPIITRKQSYILRICNFEDVKQFAKYISFSIKSKLEKLKDGIIIREKFGTKDKAVQAWKSRYKKINGIWVRKN